MKRPLFLITALLSILACPIPARCQAPRPGLLGVEPNCQPVRVGSYAVTSCPVEEPPRAVLVGQTQSGDFKVVVKARRTISDAGIRSRYKVEVKGPPGLLAKVRSVSYAATPHFLNGFGRTYTLTPSALRRGMFSYEFAPESSLGSLDATLELLVARKPWFTPDETTAVRIRVSLSHPSASAQTAW